MDAAITSLEPEVLAVLHADLRRSIDRQHERLLHLRLTAGIAMAVGIAAVGVLLPGPPLGFAARGSLLFFILSQGLGVLVLLPAEFRDRSLTMVSLRRFDSTATAAALGRRLVSAARIRLMANEPLLARRALYLKFALVFLVAELGSLALTVAPID